MIKNCEVCGKEFKAPPSGSKTCSKKCRYSIVSNKTMSNITGKRFGRLIAIRATSERYQRNVIWECLCDCGTHVFVNQDHLKRLAVKSCGCLNKDMGVVNVKRAFSCVNYKEGTNIDLISSSNLPKNNTSGHKGVSLLKNGKYSAYIGFRNKKIRLGDFSKIEDAIKARKSAEDEYYKPVIEKYQKEKAHRSGNFE